MRQSDPSVPTRATPTAKPRRPVSDFALGFVASLASVVAVFTVVSLIFTIARRVSSSTITTTMELADAEVPTFVSKSPLISSAHYSAALVTFTGVDSGNRWLFALADACSLLMVLGVSIAVLILSLRLIRGRAFAHSMTWALITNGFLIMILGTAQQYLEAQGKASLVQHVGMNLTAGGNQLDPSYEGFIAYGLNLDLVPLGIGLVLLVLTAAFAAGSRLQRDTEGLV